MHILLPLDQVLSCMENRRKGKKKFLYLMRIQESFYFAAR